MHIIDKFPGPSASCTKLHIIVRKAIIPLKIIWSDKIWVALPFFFCSLNNHSERDKFHQAILRLSASLQRNIPERGAAFKQDVKMILYHLKKCKTQDSDG